MKDNAIKRRKFLKMGAVGLAAIPVVGVSGLAMAQPEAAVAGPDSPVNADHEVIKSLRFSLESPYEDRMCANCLLFTPTDDSHGSCAIFVNMNRYDAVGAIVPAGAWCSAFIDRESFIHMHDNV